MIIVVVHRIMIMAILIIRSTKYLKQKEWWLNKNVSILYVIYKFVCQMSVVVIVCFRISQLVFSVERRMKRRTSSMTLLRLCDRGIVPSHTLGMVCKRLILLIWCSKREKILYKIVASKYVCCTSNCRN